MSHSRLLAAACVLLLAASAQAIPASPNPVVLHNADGTTLRARLLGDEHLSWAEDLEGYALAYDKGQGAWSYARQDGAGKLVPTGVRPGVRHPATLGLGPHVQPGPAVKEQARTLRSLVPLTPPAPRSGDVRNLVLLVKFSNQDSHFTTGEFDTLFNGASQSVQHFYTEVSYAKVRLVSTVVEWIPLPSEDTYYAYNDQHPDGHPEEMIKDAVAYLEAQDFDFTPFDADHDGVIDAVDVIHSGYGYEYTGDERYIHSHFASLRAFGAVVTTRSGITFDAYHTEPEYGPDGYGITMLGVICHETAHFFGVPDLYDYGYDSSGLGWWSLMASGSWAGPGMNGSSPSHPDAWTRQALGYTAPQRLDETLEAVVLAPAEDHAEVIKLVGEMPRQQYFLVENRHRRGYDAYLPGEGLLIYHVDEKQDGNNNQNHYLVDLEQPDGRRDLNTSPRDNGDEGDVYPYQSNDAFTPDSRPNSKSYSGASSKVFVLRVSHQGDDMKFNVVVGDPAPVGTACGADIECWTGYCVDGFCCTEACDGSTCMACSAAKGARVDGECTRLSGTACDDGNPCTVGDSCTSGRCRGTAKVCAPTACQLNPTCLRATGECAGTPAADGQLCDDGNACTHQDACRAGACAGTPAVDCSGECQAGLCDTQTGSCQPVADGTGCGGGSCQAGECVPDKEDGGLLGFCTCAAPRDGTAWVGLELLALLAVRRQSRRR